MSVHVRKLVLPAGRLPDCPRERRARLDAYFDDVLASVRLVAEGWEIDLNWPSTLDYYVDPDVRQGLEWWRAGTTVSDIPFQLSDTARGQLALNDAWTLYAWSKWLAERRRSGTAIHQVVVLHIDDHDDLMTPRLIFRDNNWWDAISGERFDLFDPETVRSAILTGAIGVGSFMSPFIHTLQRVHLRHLCQTTGDNDGKDDGLVTKHLPDTILAVDAYRPAIAVAAPLRPSAGSYRITRHLDTWLDALPDAPVLLHVDMDYFNNRYNRDSDWMAREGRHDPTLPDIIQTMDAVFDAINESGIAARIENVTVALSPGFFPAVLWAASIGRMQAHLARLGWAITTPEK